MRWRSSAHNTKEHELVPGKVSVPTARDSQFIPPCVALIKGSDRSIHLCMFLVLCPVLCLPMRPAQSPESIGSPLQLRQLFLLPISCHAAELLVDGLQGHCNAGKNGRREHLRKNKQECRTSFAPTLCKACRQEMY